jgi:DNA repair protein RadC
MNETIKEIPEEQRPYEKCYREGAAALSDSELLAVILRTGTSGCSSLSLANRVLLYMKDTPHPGLLGLLHLSVDELTAIHGIGKVKAIQLKCIGELSKRIASTAAKSGLSFRNPQSIAVYYMEQLRHEEQELMLCMMLDSKNHLIGEQVLSKGTVNTTVITPREILLEALRRQAVSILLVHNHPSGDPSPSTADRDVTERVYLAAEMVGITLLDHIIIGDQKYFSFLEEGILHENES